MSNTIQIARDGGEPIVISFGEGSLTPECIQASIDEAVGPGLVSVGVSRAGLAARPEIPTFRMTEDSPRARRFHASGCRWLSEARNWACAADCRVPAIEEAEAAADNDW